MRRFASFREFYPFYLAEHAHPVSRRLHFIGSCGVLVLLGVAGAAAVLAPRALGLARPRSATIASLLLAIAAGSVAWAAWIDLTTWSAAGLDPTASGQGATVFGLMSWQATFAAISVIMGGYALLRRMFGLIDPARPATCELIGLFLAFTAGQGAFVLLLTRLFPGS